MKIFGIGMNYVEHNKELDGSLYKPEEPVVFTKPDSALLGGGKPFFIPDWAGRVDYEGELVVRICRLGKSIPQRFAHRYWDAATVGVDFTARDVQRAARQAGMPWAVCKGFDGAAVVGQWVDAAEALACGMAFRLARNGRVVQRGCQADMLFGIDELIAWLSRFFTLKTGDLIYTGTPAGTGPVAVDDHIEGWLGERRVLNFNCK